MLVLDELEVDTCPIHDESRELLIRLIVVGLEEALRPSGDGLVEFIFIPKLWMFAVHTLLKDYRAYLLGDVG